MKKDQVKILAQALYDLSVKQGKREAVDNFLTYLQHRRLFHLLPKVIKEIEKLQEADQGVIKVKISSRHKLSNTVEKILVDFLEQRLQKKVKAENKVEANLLGGAVISFNDKLIDLSLRRQLNNLKKQLIS